MNMWSLTLKIHEGGTIQVTEFTQDLPPGEIELRGADDGNRVTLEVRQRDSQGRFVASAQHRRDRAGEAPGQAEAEVEVAKDFAAGGFVTSESSTTAGQVPGA